MRVLGFAVVLLVGCGGKDTTDTGTELVPTFEQNAGNTGACDDVPTYDLEGMSCDDLTDAFNSMVDAASECEEDNDCKIIHPACEHWNDVFCYYPVNKCFDDGVLAEINSATVGCISGTIEGCSCLGGPPEVTCQSGRCLPFYDF
jgi:hypothetical protein